MKKNSPQEKDRRELVLLDQIVSDADFSEPTQSEINRAFARLFWVLKKQGGLLQSLYTWLFQELLPN